MTPMTLFLHSAPISLVISLVVVALEHDEPTGYARKVAIYFGQLYGGIIAFGAGLLLLDLLP